MDIWRVRGKWGVEGLGGGFELWDIGVLCGGRDGVVGNMGCAMEGVLLVILAAYGKLSLVRNFP